MKPIIRRRILAVCVPLVTACVAFPRDDFYAASPTCPPGDRTDWVFDSQVPRAEVVRWIVSSSRGPDQSQCYGSTACAYVFQQDGRNVGVIYASIPRFAAPEWLREHEECHTKGWKHK
jgi:hypothetical protein